MTGTELATEIRRKTGTTATSFTNAVLLPIVNFCKDEISNLIAQKNESYFIVPANFNLVTSTVSAREYPWPDDVLNHIVSLELAFDSTQSPLKYVEARPYPGGYQRLIRQINGLTEGKVTNNFTNEDPFYVLTRRGIYILSGTISAVTDGGRLRYRAFPADLANLTGSTDLGIDPSTITFGMPKQFHELWARLVSICWKSDRVKPIPLSARELNYENDLKEALDAIATTDWGEEIIGSIPEDLGDNY